MGWNSRLALRLMPSWPRWGEGWPDGLGAPPDPLPSLYCTKAQFMATNRPRGFAPWKPHPKSQELLDQVQEVLDTYRDLLPLTGRQIFYRLVATTAYDKTEEAYKRLLNLLNRARRAQIIGMNTIRDDGAITAGAGRFVDDRDFLNRCQKLAVGFQLDLLQFQPHYVELLCEAGGMVPQLQRVAEFYGVTVRSSGGFDSTTVKHSLGRHYADQQKPVIALHVGDLDPSGEHICANLGEDVGAFAAYYGGQASVLRIAVTADQQRAFGLPTAPAKKTDRRSFSADFTVQAEALPPDALATIVRDAIEAQLDMEALAWAQRHQHLLRNQLQQRMAALIADA